MSKYIKKTNNLRGGKLDLSKILICESDIIEATVPTTKQQWDELIVPRDFMLAFLKNFIINKIFHQATSEQISSMESGGNISFYFVNNLGNLYQYLNEQKIKKNKNSLNVDDILSNLKNQKTYISIYTEVEKICKSLGIRSELTEEQLILDAAQAKMDTEQAKIKLEQARLKLEQEEQARIDAEKANNISIKKEDLKAIIDGIINTSRVPVIQQNAVELVNTINYDVLPPIVNIKKTGLDAYLESLMKNFFDMLFTYLKKIHKGKDVTTLNLKIIKKNLYKEITDKINNSMSGGEENIIKRLLRRRHL